MKEKLIKIGNGIDKVLEIITDCTFLLIFITFMLTIISRYIFRKPITWSYEVSVLAYMWTMFFGVGLGMKRDEHVVFGLVYDLLKPYGQFMFKMIYNIFLIVLLLVCFIPCCQSLLSSTMITGVLKIPYKVAFAPCIFMFVDIIVRSFCNLSKARAEYKENLNSDEKKTVEEHV
jgi:TRAP-type C4-dicarboxylate transport system permease small subunit